MLNLHEHKELSPNQGGQIYVRTYNPTPGISNCCSWRRSISPVCIQLLDAGIKNILLEKPGSLDIEGLDLIKHHPNSTEATISVAYNRRFYSSVLELKDRILKEVVLVLASLTLQNGPTLSLNLLAFLTRLRSLDHR